MKDFDGLEFDQDYIKKLRAGDKDIEDHFLAYFGVLLRIKLRSHFVSSEQLERVRDKILSKVLESIRCAPTIDYAGQLTLFVSKVCKEVLRDDNSPEGPSSSPATPSRKQTARNDLEEAWTRKLVREIIRGFSDTEQQLLRAVLVSKRNTDEVCRELGLGPDYLPLLLFRAKKRFLLRCKMLKRND